MENCFICNSEPKKVIVSGAEMYHCPNCDPDAKSPVLPENWNNFVRGQKYVRGLEKSIDRLSALIEQYLTAIGVGRKALRAVFFTGCMMVILSFFDVKPLTYTIAGITISLLSLLALV